MRDGTTESLATLDITVRRDECIGHPQVNRAGSQLGREQESANENF
ncbi:ATPase RIL [Halosimplex carlsbadense 2-9-1]|uniref:ATPase RIL n=1 Tax=Halosimplex carlsbadense 2-9-1 TaxID=797114 RepID=M0D4G8_9EURY|nr:hypothetical protein [Halosimplex carlsbadense]ELZ30350.1 ATPase RIL [Halosimplex carlsbadense 2-9-1]